MTTAASVAVGRSWNSPGSQTSRMRMTAAPTSPVTWLWAPAASAAGVRDALLLTGKPWNSPVRPLATPRATSSWFWSTS